MLMSIFLAAAGEIVLRVHVLLFQPRFTVPFPKVTQTDVSGINNRGQIVGRYIERAPSVRPNQIFFVDLLQRRKIENEILVSRYSRRLRI